MMPLPVRAEGAPLIECHRCAACCTYVAVGINAPRTSRYATDILWYLYHDRVSVWLDSDGEWSVVFETPCRNLSEAGLCRIYEQRPEICREFDNRTCEVNAPGGGTTFTEPAQFLEYLRARRPSVYGKVMKSYVPDALLAQEP